MNDSHYIKQSVSDENFSKRADDAGRLYKSHAVADDIARELYESIVEYNIKGDEHEGKIAAFPDRCTGPRCRVGRALKRYEQVMGDE